MKRSSAALEWQEGPQFNRAGGQLTVALRTESTIAARPESDAIVKSLPAAVRKRLTKAGVKDDSEFAWSWQGGELEADLQADHFTTSDIASAVSAWTAARNLSLDDMQTAGIGKQQTETSSNQQTPTPTAAPVTQKKIRQVHLYGIKQGAKAAPPAETVIIGEPVDGDVAHGISGRTLSEITCILRLAGNDLMLQSGGVGLSDEDATAV